MTPSSTPITPTDVSDSFVASVLGRWRTLVQRNMDRDWKTLIDCEHWQFAESLQYLMSAILVELGVVMPSAVAFSLMTSTIAAGECEMLLIWVTPEGGRFDLYQVTPQCTVIRMDAWAWPSRVKFLSRESEKTALIKRWAWAISGVTTDMPKGD